MSEKGDLVLIIALFGVYGSVIEGRTKIQKMICILKEKGIQFSLDFKPYYYGPYSDQLSDNLNTLIGMNLINETINPAGYNRYRYDYRLTPEGYKLYNKIENKLTSMVDRIRIEVEPLRSMSIPELVREAKRISGITSIHHY